MTFRKTPSAALLSALSIAASLWMTSASAQATAQASQSSFVDVPSTSVYALTSDNSIYVLPRFGDDFLRLGRVSPSDGGNLIGVDFRPADGKLYALTDLGNIFTIDVSSSNFGDDTLISNMNPRFVGGLGNVMDFNPVVNALRVTGNSDQNIAVANGSNGSNLTVTTAQTKLAYVTGDVNAGQDPEIVGGAYNNNVVGATVTIFYMIDHNLDTLVTIATKNATGSSNTGGGQLKTIGPLVDSNGNRINMAAGTDFDIFTDSRGTNSLVGISTGQLFSIDLSQVNADLAVGKLQNVVVRRGSTPFQSSNAGPFTGTVIDVAMVPNR